MSEPVPSLNFAQVQVLEKHLRFEKIAEKTTYFVVLGALVLTFLPFNFSIERNSLYVLFILALILSYIWFRLLPKSFIGPLKSFLYFFVSISFIYLGVHFTNGLQSVVIFLFYLSILKAAAYIELRSFSVIVVLVSALLFLEAALFSPLPKEQALSLWLLHTWSVAIIALFGRYVFDEEKKAEVFGESIKLKTAKQIDEVKNEFVFVISKKLKEPILVLENYLAQALRGVDEKWSSELKDFLDKAFGNTHRLSNLVNDLSDLSKIEGQKLRLDLKAVDLKQIIGSTLSDFSMRAAEKNVTLKYQPPAQNILVLADGSRLHEILANLVDNAIKYSTNSTTIQIKFAVVGSFVQVDVLDNGLGIPDQAKSHLFEKFYRVQRGDGQPKGTGLGLFITKELVERQGGKIWFESKVNQGTAFHFTLPQETNG